MIKRLTQAQKDLIDELYPIEIKNFQYKSMCKLIGTRTIDNKTEQKILNKNSLKIELIKDFLRTEFSYPIHLIPVFILIDGEFMEEIPQNPVSSLMKEFELTEDEIMVILQYLYSRNLATYYAPWNITFWCPKK